MSARSSARSLKRKGSNEEMQQTMNRSQSEKFRLTIQVDDQTLKRVASANQTFKSIREKNALNAKYLAKYDKFISPIQNISPDFCLSHRSSKSIAQPLESARGDKLQHPEIEDDIDQHENMQNSNTSNFYIVRPGTMPHRFVDQPTGNYQQATNMTVQSFNQTENANDEECGLKE